MSSTSTKKKFSFGKLLIWIIVIVVALHIFTDGESTDQLLSVFEDHGSYQPDIIQQPGYLGITIEDREGITGGYISHVKPDFSGANAGLLPGDIVVTIGNKSINSYDDIVAELSSFHVGDSTIFTVSRNGQYVTLEIDFGPKPPEDIPISTGPQNSIPQQSIPSTTTPAGTNPPVANPPVTNPPQVDLYPSVPEELRKHVYLNYRKWEHYRKLTGEVAITVIFVSDPEGSWSNGEINTVKSDLQSAVSRITSDAASYGAHVNISMHYKTVSTSVKIVDGKTDEWFESALSAAGLPELRKLISGLESAYGADSAPVFFIANHGGRAHAHSLYRCSVLYEDADAFYHELSHLYGAQDFYYPDDVEKMTKTYIPNSIMVNSSDGVMEDFTAYLIGWTDSLSENALGFLNATAYLTQEYLSEEGAKQSYTGQVTDFPLGEGTYTGYLVDGVRHGPGKYISNEGAIWEGAFVHGPLHGYGKYTSKEGAVWEGNYVQGQLNGQGTFISATGNTYTGDFLNDSFHGQGTYKWADGGSYTGGFENGKHSGQGTRIYADGASYVGQWADGSQNGIGKLIYANGAVYEGTWLAGKRHGKGTHTNANGDTYVGDWVEGQRCGQGTISYKNGNVYTGNWSNDTWNGEGTFTWTSGDKYTGAFVDGKRHGYGIYYYPSGNRYEGNWVAGERHGQGTMYYANGTSQSGNWDNGKFTG